MAKWCADGHNIDQWRYIRNMQNKAPFTFAELDTRDDPDAYEYRHRGRLAVGLGTAHDQASLAVSLDTHADWQATGLTVTKTWLDAPDEDVVVRHAVTVDDFGSHAHWLVSDSATSVHSGREIWEARAERFTHLRFLPGVEKNLTDLPVSHTKQVDGRLGELNRAISAWHPEGGGSPTWGSLVTPEHEGRKRLCEFTDLDGHVRVFDLHARYTPGPGRIHFRLNPADGTGIVAHVGRKLGI